MKVFRESQKYPGYLISNTGEVKDIITSRTVEHFSFRGADHVRIFHKGKKIIAEVARMILHAFSPLQSPEVMDRVWRHEYLDGDKKHPDLDNLRWVGPERPIPHPLNTEYFFIPEYTGYLFNKEGKILNGKTGATIPATFIEDSYACCSLMSDRGKYGSVNIHRLLMLTFKPIFFKGKKWLVNHLNGNKWDFTLDNLEWTDYSGNNQHASMTGLKTDNKPVKLYDILTGNEELIYSMAECARRFGKKTERVWDYLHNAPDKIRFGHYLVKWADDERPWPHFTAEDCFIPDNGRPKPMLLKMISTGEIIEVASAIEAEKVTGIKMGTIRYYVKNKIPRAKNGWMFKDAHDREPWLDNSAEQLFYRAGKPPERKNNFRVINTLTGESMIAKGMLEVSKIIGIDSRTIHYHLRRSVDGKRCKHFIIEKE